MHLNYPGPESCILSDSSTPQLGAQSGLVVLAGYQIAGIAFPGCPSVQFSSVTQSCPTLCDPMDRSRPGFSEILIWRAGMASGCDILVY